MKIYMNANIVNIYWCMTSEVIQGHIWSSFYLKIHFFFDILFVWYLLSDILWTTFCPCFFCILILKLRSAFVYLTYLPATLLYFIDVSQNIWKYAIIFATIFISSKDKLLKRMINKVCHILVFFFFVYFQMFKLRIGGTIKYYGYTRKYRWDYSLFRLKIVVYMSNQFMIGESPNKKNKKSLDLTRKVNILRLWRGKIMLLSQAKRTTFLKNICASLWTHLL